jgi:multicomponent Na+:H+ antiporter subunit D
MTLAGALPLPTVVMLGGAVLSPLAARVHRTLPLWIGLVASGGAFGVLVAIATRCFGATGRTVTHFFSNEHPVHGAALGIAFTADPFGVAFALLSAGVGLLLLLSALSELGHLGSRELGYLACLMQLLLAALLAFALCADLVDLFVWFEVAALASYGLTGFFLERPIAVEAAFKIAILTTMAGFGVFAAAAMLYARTGALNLGALHLALQNRIAAPELAALALLIFGFGTKAGIAPFHAWLPDAHTPVPGAVSALFSALMVNMGVLALARLALSVFRTGQSDHRLLGLLTGLGIGSALLGALLALVQDDLKRLLAWDTVSQLGILLVGFASASVDGVTGAVYHVVNHALFKALLFLCAGAVVHATGVTRLSDMGGLARRRPLLTTGFTVGALAIAGVPPLNGFASLGILHAGIRHDALVFPLALLAQAITVAALARAAYLGFYRRREREYEHLDPTRAGMRVSLICLAAGCVAFGVLSTAVVHRVAAPAASVLLDRSGYAAAALDAPLTAPAQQVPLPYANLADWLITVAEIAVGLTLAWWVVHRRVPRALDWLRRIHTGSVNDYATFSAIGLVVAGAVLLW